MVSSVIAGKRDQLGSSEKKLLLQEHRELAALKLSGLMSCRDEHRLVVVRELLDRTRDAEIGPSLDAMERVADGLEALACDIDRVVAAERKRAVRAVRGLLEDVRSQIGRLGRPNESTVAQLARLSDAYMKKYDPEYRAGWRRNMTDSDVTDRPCDICTATPTSVCSSALGAISHAYCAACLASDREVWTTLVGGLVGLSREKIGAWIRPHITASCAFYEKTEDELWDEVARIERELDALEPT
jgi:hypothetical protein